MCEALVRYFDSKPDENPVSLLEACTTGAFEPRRKACPTRFFFRSAIVICQRFCAMKGRYGLTAVVLKSAGRVGYSQKSRFGPDWESGSFVASNEAFSWVFDCYVNNARAIGCLIVMLMMHMQLGV